jgi:hypothetical protein
MKPLPLLILAWLLICLGCLALLGGPAFALSRSGYDPTANWNLGGDVFREGITESDVFMQSVPYVAAGVVMIFIGTYFRQRAVRDS